MKLLPKIILFLGVTAIISCCNLFPSELVSSVVTYDIGYRMSKEEEDVWGWLDGMGWYSTIKEMTSSDSQR